MSTAAPSPGLFEDVGAVVIGRNEGPRLLRALIAAKAATRHVVYVDSGSTDGSPEKARELGVHVVALTERPFTAAKGRQTGFDELVRLAPAIRFVQFIDGDCVLRDDWISRGAAYLSANPKVGAISGRRREEFPDKTLYNAMIDVDWDAKPGKVDYPGGDSFCRVEAVKQIGGWAVDLIAGEDPDFGFRMRDKGWEVHRLQDEMTLHDVNMRSFAAYWKRALRAGYCFLEVGWRHRHGTGRWWLLRVRSAALYSLVLPLIWAAGVLLAFLLNPWWIGLSITVLIELIYARLLLKMYVYAKARSGDADVSLAYAASNVICKLAVFLGAMKYLLAAARGRKTAIIEYKPAPGGTSP